MSRPPGEPRWNLPRILFIAGVVFAVAAVVSWVTVGTGGHSEAGGGGCRVPARAVAGTQALPPLVATLTTPLGTPDASFTETAGGTTVYGYCYDVVDGSALASTLATMRQLPYDATPGHNPTEQLNFTADGQTPRAVSVSVAGDLDVSHPVAGTKGSMSIVWTDSKVSTG